MKKTVTFAMESFKSQLPLEEGNMVNLVNDEVPFDELQPTKDCSITNGFHTEGNATSGLSDKEVGINTYADWESSKRIRIAAAFLKDYEAHRPATLFYVVDQVTDRQLLVHSLRSSRAWFAILFVASCLLMTRNWFLEYNKNHSVQTALTLTWKILTCYVSAILFLLDVAALTYTSRTWKSQHNLATTQIIASENDVVPRKPSIIWPVTLSIYLLLVLITEIANIQDASDWEDVLAPIVWYYLFQSVRDAAEAQERISLQMGRLILFKLFLVFIFSALACPLYGQQSPDNFRNLGNSFVSLFALSTTVNNPSLWIEIYNQNKLSSVFFITFNMCFILVNIIMLSLVFDAFIRAALAVRKRHSKDREDCLLLACNTLQYFEKENVIPIEVIRRVIQLLRPRYNKAKIEALLSLLSLSAEQSISHECLVRRLPKVLSMSIQLHHSQIFNSVAFKLFGLSLGLLNLSFVLTVTIPDDYYMWLGNAFFPLGCFVSLLCTAELVVKCSIGQFGRRCPRYEIDFLFDSLSAVASIVSLAGLIVCFVEQPDLTLKGTGVNLLVIGRSIDLVRIVKICFGRIMERAKCVLSVIIGPALILLTAMRAFVYIGMLLWGNKVIVGEPQEGVPEYYDLNNFNSFESGFFTVCNILIVNDWNTIAQVFIGISPNWVVMCYFIAANLILVCVLLNVVVAFFVAAFLAVDSNQEFQLRSIAQPGYSSEGDFHLKKMRRVSYNNLVHHLAGEGSLMPEEQREEYIF